MSLYNFKVAITLQHEDVPFYALIMAALMRADSENYTVLARAFPEIEVETFNRYRSPNGKLLSDHPRHYSSDYNDD